MKTLTAGDRVVSCGNLDFGAWRNKGVSNELDFLKVSETLPIPYAATILVNPCTAYRMLTDFVKLSPGDYIIQNAANSMVGMAVIQMARMRGIRTINVIRSDRPNADDAVRLCENLGGDINVLDTFVGTAAFNEMLSELPPIKLALNAVGGDSATELSRALGVNGHMVTYGGMSKKPMNIPVDVLVEKSLNLHGFWISQWHQDKNNHKARSDMIADITSMINNDQLTFFYEMHDFDDFQYALNRSMEPFNLRKIVLNMDFPDRFKEHDTKTEEDYWHFKAPNDV